MQRRATSRFKSKTCQYNTCINDSQWKHISPLFSTLCIIYLKTCRLFISFQCWFHEGFFFLYNVNLSRQFYTNRSNFLVLRHEIYLWIILLSTEVGGACRISFLPQFPFGQCCYQFLLSCGQCILHKSTR